MVLSNALNVELEPPPVLLGIPRGYNTFLPYPEGDKERVQLRDYLERRPQKLFPAEISRSATPVLGKDRRAWTTL